MLRASLQGLLLQIRSRYEHKSNTKAPTQKVARGHSGSDIDDTPAPGDRRRSHTEPRRKHIEIRAERRTAYRRELCTAPLPRRPSVHN